MKTYPTYIEYILCIKLHTSCMIFVVLLRAIVRFTFCQLYSTASYTINNGSSSQAQSVYAVFPIFPQFFHLFFSLLPFAPQILFIAP